MPKYQEFDLPLSMDYVQDWGVTEAIRELFQNALDAELRGHNMTWDYIQGEFILTSVGAEIPRASLLMGYSDKAEGSIGQFGEGYKLALLVLLRAGKNIFIKNGHELWEPRIKKSRRFGADILSIRIQPWTQDDLTFIVAGITEEEWKRLQDFNLHVSVGEHLEYGIIDHDRPGCIFVNGLFVTQDSDMDHSYNFKPEQITLDRDRRMVRSFDLHWATSQLWAEQAEAKPDEFNRMLEEGKPDVKFVSSQTYSVNKSVNVAVSHFTKKHGDDAIPISSQYEAEQFKDHKTVIVPENQRDLLRKRMSTPSVARKKLPAEFLQEWLDQYDDEIISEEAVEAFRELITRAKNWSL